VIGPPRTLKLQANGDAVRGGVGPPVWHVLGTPWGWAAASAAACVSAGLGVAALAAAGAGSGWIAAWLIACAGWGSALGAAAHRRCASQEQLFHLAERVLRELDGQSLSLEQEQRQIERLQAAMTDEALRRQVEDQLGGSAQPALLALIGQLAQAEEAVPEAAAVTKSWISRARHLASRTQFKLEQVREDVGGR